MPISALTSFSRGTSSLGTGIVAAEKRLAKRIVPIDLLKKDIVTERMVFKENGELFSGIVSFANGLFEEIRRYVNGTEKTMLLRRKGGKKLWSISDGKIKMFTPVSSDLERANLYKFFAQRLLPL